METTSLYKRAKQTSQQNSTGSLNPICIIKLTSKLVFLVGKLEEN